MSISMQTCYWILGSLFFLIIFWKRVTIKHLLQNVMPDGDTIAFLSVLILVVSVFIGFSIVAERYNTSSALQSMPNSWQKLYLEIKEVKIESRVDVVKKFCQERAEKNLTIRGRDAIVEILPKDKQEEIKTVLDPFTIALSQP